jgi:hypothetical protein
MLNKLKVMGNYTPIYTYWALGCSHNPTSQKRVSDHKEK